MYATYYLTNNTIQDEVILYGLEEDVRNRVKTFYDFVEYAGTSYIFGSLEEAKNKGIELTVKYPNAGYVYVDDSNL